MELNDSPEFLGELSFLMDRLQARLAIKKEPGPGDQDWKDLTIIEDYFTYLTVGALDEGGQAERLVDVFEDLEERSGTHSQFFSALAQLLSVKHGIEKFPTEDISEDAFMERWEGFLGRRGESL